jgi:hypothetical protein
MDFSCQEKYLVSSRLVGILAKKTAGGRQKTDDEKAAFRYSMERTPSR